MKFFVGGIAMAAPVGLGLALDRVEPGDHQR